MSKFYTSVTRHKNIILESGYKDGVRFREVTKYKPYLFLPATTETKFQTVDGKFVSRKFFASIGEANKFIDQYKEVSGFKLYGNENFLYNYIYDNYGNKIEFDEKLIKTGYLDIEVDPSNGFPEADKATEIITAITVVLRNHAYVWGCQPFENKSNNVTYQLCTDELDLIERFLTWWENTDLDIISGWYIRQFDIPYLVNRITNVTSKENAERLSPWRKLTKRTIEIQNRDTTVYVLEGIATLDYIELYKYFVLEPRESFKLDYIAYVELGENKLDYSPYKNLAELYEKDYQKFIEYNIKDAFLVEKLDKKRSLVSLAIAFAYDANVNIPDIFGALRVWDTIITNYLMNMNVVVPHFKPLPNSSIVGAYVKDPIVGMHKNVVSFDLTSLYPMLMRQYNMSPETKVSVIKSETFNSTEEFLEKGIYRPVVQKWYDADCTVTANGVVFSKAKQGIIPHLIEERFNKRDAIKDEMKDLKRIALETNDESEATWNKIASLDNAQKAIKVELNSVYGACCNMYFRWADNEIAQAVTIMGQMVIKHIAEEINKFLNACAKTTDRQFVVAIDTDSNYLALGDLVSEEGNLIDNMDEFCEKIIQPQIDLVLKRLSDRTHAYQHTMHMKREAICDRAVWTGKKRYILNVHDNEGVRYKTPELKVVGSEAIRSTTPEVVRKIIKRAYEYIISDDLIGLKAFISEKEAEFMTLDPIEIARPSSVNGLDKYHDKMTLYTKGTPMHVRGALLYNKYITEKGLDTRYPKINEGEKIKTVNLVVPNPIREDVISFPDSLPAELGLHSYVDYKLQWEKTCFNPLEDITKKIGWELKKRATLPI